MFDFTWTEIAVVAAVALVAIGPKDMPVAIRTVTSMIKKARRMASEFQGHVDEMLREANLDEVRNQINEIRNFDVRGEIERNVDPDGSLRGTFDSNPLLPEEAGPDGEQAVAVADAQAAELERPPDADRVSMPAPIAPAFIPPGAVAPEPALRHDTAESEPEPPAFIPPEVARQHRPQAPA